MNINYIAGFFDGEGNLNVALIWKKNKNTNERIMKSYQLKCRFYNSEKNVLEEIKNFLGLGTIYTREMRNNQLQVHELDILGKDRVLKFLNLIKDKCIIKREQINYLLENFDFNLKKNNLNFDIDKFRSFIKRTGSNKFRKNHTIPPIPNNL